MSSNGQTSDFSQLEYERFTYFIEKMCGIVVGKNKQYLVKNRLRPILKSNNFNSLTELVSILESNERLGLKELVIDAMTTNETFWFRDQHPFNFLENKLLKQLARNNHNKSIRIWCCACSSGQEPYSIAISALETKKKSIIPSNVSIELVATDISQAALNQAEKGCYDNNMLSRGMPEEFIKKYFKKINSDCFQVNDDIRRIMQFRKMNLKEPFSYLGNFDLVVCRNVLIYFTEQLKIDILSRIRDRLKPESYLFLGSSESAHNVSDLYATVKYDGGVIYKTK